jgi:metal-responsive CopG/Arc/MetJ family transcriptional regulator
MKSSNAQTFNVSFSKDLLDEVDAKAAEQFGSRSDFLRAAAVQYLRREEEWEYIFREGEKAGAKSQFRSAEEATEELTKQRRASGRWFARQSN